MCAVRIILCCKVLYRRMCVFERLLQNGIGQNFPKKKFTEKFSCELHK